MRVVVGCVRPRRRPRTGPIRRALPFGARPVGFHLSPSPQTPTHVLLPNPLATAERRRRRGRRHAQVNRPATSDSPRRLAEHVAGGSPRHTRRDYFGGAAVLTCSVWVDSFDPSVAVTCVSEVVVRVLPSVPVFVVSVWLTVRACSWPARESGEPDSK